MIPLLLALLPLTAFIIGCAMKSNKAPPQFEFKNSSKSIRTAEETKLKSEEKSIQNKSDRGEEPSSSKEGTKGTTGGSGGKTADNSCKKAPIIYTPKRIHEPKINELNAKEKAIAAGAKKERNEYPTFDDVHSDWEGPLGEMQGGEGADKKAVETN